MYFLYSAFTALAAILLLPYWVVQGLRHGKYFSNLGQRLGLAYPTLEKLPRQRPGAIWVHAVSVGEALAGLGLARRLKEQNPGRPLIVSTTTLTGQTLARERMPFADAVVYFPLDWGFAVRRAFRAVQPEIVVILETELWPNFLREAARRSVPVVVVSGRLSPRSFARYQRWLGALGLFLRPFLARMLALPAAFLMQTADDAARIRALGAPPGRVFVSGNLKYDQELPADSALCAWLEKEVNARSRRPLVVAGSVVANEEPLTLIAFGTARGEHPRALLVLAPRKPERFEAAAEFIREAHWKFLRRSQLAIPGPFGQGLPASGVSPVIPDDVTVLLLDSIGELASLYRAADVVFVGGSLVPSGGHNILEPAAFGKIPVFGPHTENFAEMTARFVEAGAAIRVESPEDVGVAWIDLLKNPARMQEMGAKAKRLVEESRGATARALAEITRVLGGGKGR
ncbi:MAG: 3-deoxy-D-manno-octulosonic acid transferase [Acidobacteriia bacterium]|nr:3-deoxy-D-manno-octulosonic acid transferase [Terriglobia bacterium]